MNFLLCEEDDMKIKATVNFNTDNGDYEITYNNLSTPGDPIDFQVAVEYLKKIFADNERNVINSEASSWGGNQ